MEMRILREFNRAFMGGLVRLLMWGFFIAALVFIPASLIPPYTKQHSTWLLFGVAFYFGAFTIAIYRALRSKS